MICSISLCLKRLHHHHRTLWRQNSDHRQPRAAFQVSCTRNSERVHVPPSAEEITCDCHLVSFFYTKRFNTSKKRCQVDICVSQVSVFVCSPLSCMDPSIAIKPVFQRFQSVVITSGVRTSFLLISVWWHLIYNFYSLKVQKQSGDVRTVSEVIKQSFLFILWNKIRWSSCFIFPCRPPIITS